jgi:hypothetical protein
MPTGWFEPADVPSSGSHSTARAGKKKTGAMPVMIIGTLYNL